MINIKKILLTTNILVIIMAVILLTELGPTPIIQAIAAENHTDDIGEEHEDEGHGKHGEEIGHSKHGEEAGHGQHDEHEEEEGVVNLTEEEMKEFGIVIGTAGSGKLSIYVTLPGEIAINSDKMAHIVPRVGGVVRDVRKKLGNMVKKGEVMAVLESRELADAKTSFFAAIERRSLAEANFTREKALWKKKISSEQTYLNARLAFAETSIELRSSEQKLRALGFSDSDLSRLPEAPDSTFTFYNMTAPFNGTVIEKHITLGEVLKNDTEAYVIADLKSVWVNLDLYQKDLPLVKNGDQVIISAGHGIPGVTGKISYIGPIVRERTRTALARVVLPNKQGLLRPGLFVSAKVAVEKKEVSLIVRKTAIQTIDDKPVIFILDEDGFEPKPVIVGQSDAFNTEIISGINAGQQYVTKGAFTLKAQLAKGSFASGHAH